MANYPLYLALPGMDVYLAENFFKGVTDRPKRMHSHPAYELVCVERPDHTEFIIVPPLKEHLAAEAASGRITSLLFSFSQSVDNDICFEMKSITDAPVTVPDDFDGATRIRNAKELAQNLLLPGAREQLAAEFRLRSSALPESSADRTRHPLHTSRRSMKRDLLFWKTTLILV